MKALISKRKASGANYCPALNLLLVRRLIQVGCPRYWAAYLDGRQQGTCNAALWIQAALGIAPQ